MYALINCDFMGQFSETGGRRWSAWSTMFGVWAVSPTLMLLNNHAIVVVSGRPGLGLWVSTDPSGAAGFRYYNLAQQHNALVNSSDLAYSSAVAAVATSQHDMRAVCSSHNPDFNSLCHGDCECAGQTTSYTAAIELDTVGNRTELLVLYDRLAGGWQGPPGPYGRADFVFSMRVTISALKSDDDDATSVVPLLPGHPQQNGSWS